MNFTISYSKKDLKAEEFIEISQKIGWGKNKVYDFEKVQKALKKTNFMITLRDESQILIGCVRVISD